MEWASVLSCGRWMNTKKNVQCFVGKLLTRWYLRTYDPSEASGKIIYVDV